MKKIIGRSIEKQIEKYLFKNKIIILYGARQVGKTFLSKKIAKGKHSLYLDCEKISVREVIESQNLERIKSFLGEKKLVILDEAQKVKNIGTSLKLLVDHHPNMQIIATGSSSFDLSNKVLEPLTGRNFKFNLYPFSLSELKKNLSPENFSEKLESFLRFGMYPDVALSETEEEARFKLDEIANDYLYQDVLAFEKLKKPDLLLKLLQAIALQLGNEVSFRELASLLQTSGETVQRYLDLLEKTFVIFKLHSFSRNLRKEIGKKIKIYFYDLGIRNSLIQNFAPLNLRNDIGALWENFCISERIKINQERLKKVNKYFWRTYSQKEIDYIEEKDGLLEAYEFKWSPRKKPKAPQEFLENYQNSSFEIISRENYGEFLL